MLRYDGVCDRRDSNGYPRRDSPLREKRGSVSPERECRYDLIERRYLADKLQSQIDLRERRLAELEAKERFVRADLADREKERPLRRDSRSRERRPSAKDVAAEASLKPMMFETDAEKEAALRRRRVIEQTAPRESNSGESGGEKDEVEWLNQVSSNERRSNSNSD